MITPSNIFPISRLFKRSSAAQPFFQSAATPILSPADRDFIYDEKPYFNTKIWESPYIPTCALATGSTSTFFEANISPSETNPAPQQCDIEHCISQTRHRNCADHPAGCPRHALESAKQRDIMYVLMQEQGRKRFPPRSHEYFLHNHVYLHSLRPIAPGTFDGPDLVRIRSSKPFQVALQPCQIYEEERFQGPVYRLSTLSQHYEEDICRGTTIVINNYTSQHAIYVVTIRRHLSRDFSLVQLNAVACDNSFLADHNLDWPTLLMSVPNPRCRVPMPRTLVPYYSDYIAGTPPSFLRRIFCRSASIFIKDETKWEVEIID